MLIAINFNEKPLHNIEQTNVLIFYLTQCVYRNTFLFDTFSYYILWNPGNAFISIIIKVPGRQKGFLLVLSSNSSFIIVTSHVNNLGFLKNGDPDNGGTTASCVTRKYVPISNDCHKYMTCYVSYEFSRWGSTKFSMAITKHITHQLLCHANSLGKEISNFTLKYINYHYLLWLHITTVGYLVLCNLFKDVIVWKYMFFMQ